MSHHRQNTYFQHTNPIPDGSDVFGQYWYHLMTWCLYHRRDKPGREWAKTQKAVVVDVPAARAIIEIAKTELTRPEWETLEREFAALYDSRINYVASGYQRARRFRADEWGMYYKYCILCKGRDSRNKSGGKCARCVIERWKKEWKVAKLKDAIHANQQKGKNEVRIITASEASRRLATPTTDARRGCRELRNVKWYR